MGSDVEKRRSGGVGVFHGVTGVVVAVVGVLVAFWALSFIAGLVWALVKVAVIVAVVLGVLWLLVGRRGGSRR